MFGYVGTRAGSYKGCCGGDVEQFAATAAGAAGVYQGFTNGRHLGGQRAHGKRRPSDLFSGLSFDAKCGEQRSDLPRGGFARHDLLKNRRSISLAEIIALDDSSERLRYIHDCFLSLEKIV